MKGHPLLPFGGFLLCAALLAGCSDRAQVALLSGQTMGTSYHVSLWPPPAAQVRTALQRAIDQRLQEINQQMSTYIDDSALQLFNRSRSTDWQAVEPAIVELVRRASAVSRLTGGMYDVTVGPLVALWGFGNAGSRDTPPPTAQIRDALLRVGHTKLLVGESPPRLRKTVAQLEIDLSSIAKGWAVDQLGELLQAHDIDDFLVEIGGEVLAVGQRPDGKPWRVAIERPDELHREILHVVALSGQAMATSGDYRNYFEANGERYSHTLNPMTGQAIRHALASVTVLADNCTDADAWSTALLAAGDERGPELAEANGLQAFFVIRDGTGFRTLTSSALAASGLLEPDR